MHLRTRFAHTLEMLFRLGSYNWNRRIFLFRLVAIVWKSNRTHWSCSKGGELLLVV
uniref:Uncharacterized protein n=1 Tax=Arundo donax TaxID=35708 RepID=A0A0A9GCK7_ARUDO